MESPDEALIVPTYPDVIRAQAAQIAELTVERDRARAMQLVPGADFTVIKTAELTALEARVSELTAERDSALAEVAELMDDTEHDILVSRYHALGKQAEAMAEALEGAILALGKDGRWPATLDTAQGAFAAYNAYKTAMGAPNLAHTLE
jgi:hypothetical protein